MSKSFKNIMGLLSNILKIDQNLNGKEYLQEFIKNIAINLDVNYVLIGHSLNKDLTKIMTDVVWSKNGFMDNFTYKLKGSPCELVLKKERVCIHASNVSKDFPEDKLLQDMNIEAYIGAPVISKRDNNVSSILVLLNEKPIKNIEFFAVIIEFLAIKASAEIEKIYIEDNLKKEVERRTKELEVANKRILFLNKNLEFERSEKRFKILFEQSPIGMTMVDYETGVFLEVNNTLLNITAYTKDEFLNLSFWDITPQEYKEQELKQIEELNKIGRFGPNEKEYIKKDGTKCPIKISGFVLENIDGRKVVWEVIEDITISKQYEIIYKDNKELLEYITIESNLQKILDKIVEYAQKRNPQSLCSILLLDDLKKHLLHGSAPSLPKFYNESIHGIEIGEKVGSCGKAAFKKQRVIVENINTHENWQEYLELTQKANLHACWSEPIISTENEVLGTFAIYNKEPKKPSEFELKLIEIYANIVAKAIEKYNYTKKIKDKQKRVEELFNNSQSGLLYIDENGKLIKANQKFADIMGYNNPDDMVNLDMKIFHLNDKSYNEFEKKNFEKLIKYGENYNLEYEFKRKDGTLIWCELSGKALDSARPADPKKGFLWTFNDISLRVEYEKKLKEKQLLLKNIFTTIPNMVWLKNARGVYLTCNDEFEKFFGATEEEIVGKTDYDFVNKELADSFRIHDKNAMNTSKTLVNEEWVTYATDKRRVLLDTSKKAMRDEEGNVIGVLGIGHDVTQRKLKEEKLKELNALAQSLTKSQEVLLSLFDKGESVLFRWKNGKKWKIEYVSKSVFQLLVYDEESLLNHQITYEDCIHSEDIERVHKEVEEALEKNLDYFKHKPYRIITKSGEEKWVIDNTATQKDKNGNVTHFIGYVSDITEQIKNQEIIFHQTKVVALGEMLSNISHQWRQPLSVISTTATGSRLKKELNLLDDEEFYKNMDSINGITQYLSKTIDDFRNFFLLDNSLDKELDLSNVIEKVDLLIKDSFNSSNIVLIKNYAFHKIKIVCNENLLIQALINILNNAKDALIVNEIKDKDRFIFIDLEEKEDEVQIKIKDTANGIPLNVITKIFEPYFTTKHQSQGTGIGLYMTNQIITKHLKGKIFVENLTFEYQNKKYTGACFIITIKKKI